MTNTPNKSIILAIQNEPRIQGNHSGGFGLWVRELDTGGFSIFTTDREFIRELEKRKDVLRLSSSNDPESPPTFIMYGGWRELDRLVDRFFAEDRCAENIRHQNASASHGGGNGGSQ